MCSFLIAGSVHEKMKKIRDIIVVFIELHVHFVYIDYILIYIKNVFFFFLNFQSQNFTKINNVNIYDFSTLHSKTPPLRFNTPPPPPPLYKLKYMRY